MNELELDILIERMYNRMRCYYKTDSGKTVWGYYHGFLPQFVPEFIEVVW